MPEQLPPEVAEARTSLRRLMTERARVLDAARGAGRVEPGRVLEVEDRIREVVDRVRERVGAVFAPPDVPLVLLPVRVETRFDQRGPGTVLQVRVYPDDIHVDGLERGLTQEEYAAGLAWWQAAWAGGDTAGPFAALVAAVGAHRSEWVAHATTPVNLADRPSGVPEFPPRLTPLRRGAVARALPDRFVALAVQGGTVSRGEGAAVPPELLLSPVPTTEQEAPAPGPGLLAAEGAEWLVDYARALEVGMALEVPLSGGTARVDRLVVLGTRAAADPDAGAGELEELLVGHRYGQGLGLLEQGTATNNSDVDRSPYRPRPEPVVPPVDPVAAVDGSDTAALARLLGVDAGLLTGLLGAGSGEQALAGHVNAALWGAGWGNYLADLDSRDVPGVTRTSRDRARRLFASHVRGRGPAPALRVGPQPYGVLPVSDARRWQTDRAEDGAGVSQVVARLLDQWLSAAAANVPTIRPGQAGIDQTMLDVLGSSPVMQYLRVRPELADGAAAAAAAAVGAHAQLYAWEQWLTAAVASRLLGVDGDKLSLGSLHADDRPLPLPLVSERDEEFIAALLGKPSKVLPVDSVLQALVYLSWQHAEREVTEVAPGGMVEQVTAAANLDPRQQQAVTTLVSKVDTASPEQIYQLAGELAEPTERDSAQMRVTTYQAVPVLQTSLAEVALSAAEDSDLAQMAGKVLGEWLFRMGYRSELRAALQALLGSGLEARRLAVAESLDLASHRLDAWATAVVTERRARQAAGGGRGLTIGAYGVVEDLQPRTAAPRGGWIHAPSPEHAAAAGMLRSAHLSHLPDAAEDGGPFAIDLSSHRARAADRVLQGVRAGQQLAALVGYQIERDLVSRGHGRLQLSLRAVAPLVAERLTDRDDAATEPRSVQEAVAATDVVDGLLLLHRHPPGDPALRPRLDVPPENPFLAPDSWKPVNDEEWADLTAVLQEAADTVDAVADALLAESVLQYAGGNPGRAAAAMDVMGEGGPVADTLDVLEAHDSAERLTHEALLVVGTGAPASGWDTTRPRALAEPVLEGWAASQLGRPEDVVLAASGSGVVTLAGAGLAALDLVFAGDLAGLERQLRQAVPALAGLPLALDRDPAWPPERVSLGDAHAHAATLRALVAGSGPLLPEHLVRTDTDPVRDLRAALPELAGRMEALATGFAAAVAELAGELSAVPDAGVVTAQATADAVTGAIHALDSYGVPLPEAPPDRPLDLAWARAAWQAAEARATNALASLARLRDKDEALAQLVSDGPAELVPSATTAVLEAAQDVATGVLGEGFTVVPVLPGVTGPDPFADALTQPVFPQPAASAVRRFVQDHATVRTQLQRWSECRLVAGALGRAGSWTVGQLAEVGPEGPAPGTTRWLAGPLPEAGPWPRGPVTHLVVELLGQVRADRPVAGLVVDTWVEDLPEQPGPDTDPEDPQPERVRTGLAVRVEAPSARPPQALLCAVSPDGRRWTEESVRAVVEGTLDLARARLVSLERTIGEARVIPALYTRHWSLQGAEQVDWLRLSEAHVDFHAAVFVKDV